MVFVGGMVGDEGGVVGGGEWMMPGGRIVSQRFDMCILDEVRWRMLMRGNGGESGSGSGVG